MKKLGILCLIFGLSGCATASPVENIEVDGLSISLNLNSCITTIGENNLAFKMEPICHFVKNTNADSVRVKYYKDIDSYVILVVGKTLPPDSEYPLTVNRNDCGSQVKALIIKNGNPAISAKSFTDTVTCAGVGVDGKDYYILSHI